jgi:hypothetical protein
MRRLSTVSLLQQATLLSDLVRHSGPEALAHHRGAFETFFATLRDRALVTHSVLPGIPPGPISPPADPAAAAVFLEAVVDRRIKLALRP